MSSSQVSLFQPRKRNLRSEMHSRVEALVGSNSLSREERAVLRCVWDAYRAKRRITQRDIARSERWLGCHPKHEVDVVRNIMETTTRRVRSIIRELRIKHDLPILDYSDGYTLPSEMPEVETYLLRKEQEARARAAASMQTYYALKRSLGVRSELFEALHEAQQVDQQETEQ